MDWLPWLDIAHSLHWLSQTPTPTPPPSPTATELELLRQQIDFLKEANASLADNFDRYVNMVQVSIRTTGIIVGAIAILGTALSIKSLLDFRNALDNMNKRVKEVFEREIQTNINQEVQAVVEQEIRSTVYQEVAIALRTERKRLNRLENILAREDIPERIAIDYVIPAAKPISKEDGLKNLLKILGGRGFGTFLQLDYDPAFQDRTLVTHKSEFAADVVVLDLYHCDLDQNQARAEEAIQAVGTKLRSNQPTALVVYGNGRFDAVVDLNSDGRYCSASNNPLTVVARVLEAAYAVDALKNP